MAWIILLLAGLAEVCWAIGLKYTQGFTKLWPSVFTLTFMVISVVLLAVAVKKIPLGTAYAVWTGIGVVGAVTYGAITGTESLTVAKTCCLLMVVSGIVGLKLLSGPAAN